jgi:microcystin-dependent protein
MSVQPILFDTIRFTTRKYVFENKDVGAYTSNLITIFQDRIGIGTDLPDPNYTCTIEGNTLIRGSLTASFLDAQSSNLGYLVLENSGGQPTIDIIQNTPQPYIRMIDQNDNLVTLFDGQGNLGIGTTIAHEKLTVYGTVAVNNIEFIDNPTDARDFQLRPIQQLYRLDSFRDTFTATVSGFYTVSPQNAYVYWNGYKLAYLSETNRDYTATSAYDQNTNQTTFTITLLRTAQPLDVVDITIFPQTLESTSGKYVQTIDLAYWERNTSNQTPALYTLNKRIGINTSNPQYDLHVEGTLFTSNLITNLLNTAEIDIPNLDCLSIHTQSVTTHSLAIGTPTTNSNAPFSVTGDFTVTNGTLELSASNEPTLRFYQNDTPTITLSASSNTFTLSPHSAQYHFGNAFTLQNSNVTYHNGLTIGYPTNTPNQTNLIVAGNVGIGTTLPSSKLDVRGDLRVSGTIYRDNNVYYTSSQWLNQGSNIYYTTGNVGIGTTLPTNRLHVQGNTFIQGSLGIGTTLPTTPLDVRGTLRVTGNVRSPSFVGMVTYCAGATPPPGWLECNGQLVNRIIYADLFAYIGTTYGSGDGVNTFALPDLRGEFIRGWDNGRNVDLGRTFGSFQNHALENHNHQFNYLTTGGGGTLNTQTVFVDTLATNTAAIGGVQLANTATETRPRNVAMLPIIKF